MKAGRTRTLVALSLVALGLTLAEPASASSRATDQDITFWVKAALRQDTRVKAPELTVVTNDGIVTLSGNVETLAAKDYALREAKKIRDVLGVIDQITVMPDWRSDADIQQTVRRRILNSAIVNSDNVSVESVGGRVTLSGEVDSWSEWNEAGVLARSVRGVQEVINNLTTVQTTERSDQEIKNDAVAALARDVYTTGLPIAVSVRDGVITLSGSVGNAYEKERAGDAVRWIAEVRQVKNLLSTEWTQDHGVRETPAKPSDPALTKSVRAELDHDWRLDASDVSVTASHGHVVLKGSVYSHYERRIAGEDARDVVGVGWVTNNLFPRVDEREDPLIAGDVQFSLDTDATVSDLGIKAKVKHGTVTLSGTAHNWNQKLHAGELASGVKGVKRVVNEVAVSQTTWKSDAELTKEILSHLTWNWSTWWVHDDIGVTVQAGVATLSGNVDKWSQRKEAEIIALETPGVWKVDNRLTVNGYDYPWDEWHTRFSHELDTNLE